MFNARPPEISPELRAAYERAGYWPQKPVAAHVAEHARSNPSSLAVTDGSGFELNYAELEQAVRAAASWFEKAGLRAGDAIVMALRNEIDYVIAHLAASRIGIVSVMLSAREGKADILHAIRATNAKMILVVKGKTSEALSLSLSEATTALPFEVALMEVDVSPEFTGDVSATDKWPGWKAFKKHGADETVDFAPVRIPKPDDFEMVVFSSGTTGQPKGIAHTYNGTGASLFNWINELKLTRDDTVFCPATLGHVGGSQWGLRTAMVTGAPLVLMDKWEPVNAAKQIAKYGCKYTLVTPTFIIDLMNLPEQDRDLLRGFRIWTVGGSGMSAEFVMQSEKKLPGLVLRGFGMSEHFMSTITRPEDPIERKRNFDGRELPGCEIQVWDENGTPLPPGTPGEMAVRGPSIVAGYFTHPEETERCYVRGWQLTGDIIIRDEAGYIRVVGRKKEIIIRGGENISPIEIETVIMKSALTPACMVVGIPDERLGERVGLVYEMNQDPIDFPALLQFLAEADLARYKWPEVLIGIKEFPRTALGKIRRGQVGRAVLADFKDGELEVLSRIAR